MSNIGFYDENAEDYFRRTVDSDMTAARRLFASQVAPGGRVLDAGCGSGRDALAFHQMGFEVTATEAAPRLAEIARRHTGLVVDVLTFDQMAWRDHFDGIWACGSLLHVPRVDLPATLRRLRDALVPGGAWFMSFKYGPFERPANGRRFTDLDEEGAAELLAQVRGLQLISMDVVGDSRADRSGERWLSLLCRRG
ncbi:class I SAM-dependent methyltransferase [Phenylobacterium soli]|uniref:SAM-dependent methyltransferase n=1 Tax=Phenylobacterium soli TaxID=2170551 RepID=A0A328AGY0_9CAUL|nr:class I SAM-dependent methyltransferase [Phenylobacterium soli]RAK53767.1 SAM-dependent methyltransferase [Phenylobacterium soli]